MKAIMALLSSLFLCVLMASSSYANTNAIKLSADSSKSDVYWMAMNIYYEAGNQPLIGKIAVGVVTLNRLHDKRFPKNIRDVVTQPSQFSWYSAKSAAPPANNKMWKESYRVASLLLTKAAGNDIIDILEGATHFHANNIKPIWVSTVTKIATIEGHTFYRMK
jgi:spore germination cell wall hydrolase CwlJ-like protein